MAAFFNTFLKLCVLKRAGAKEIAPVISVQIISGVPGGKTT